MKTHTQHKAILLTHVLKADASGSYPTEIQIAKTGYWQTPWHGEFSFTIEDFDQAVSQFDAGVYRVNGTEPLPGTLDHLGGESPAAFRINSIYRTDDTLWASVTWTALGKEKLDRDEYRYISFEYCTRDNPMPNPENVNEMFVNVVTGATLTNDPLFKKLKPVMASARSGDIKEGDPMDLEAIRAKKLEELSEEEKTFLEENKDQLTDDERTAFGVTVEVVETDEEKAAREAEEATAREEEEAAKAAAKEAKETQKLAAAAKSLGLSVKDLKTLQADAKAGREAQQELLKSKLTASIEKHVSRGAIKSDQLEAGVELLMASSEKDRAKLTSFLEALPSNKLIASAEKGSGEEGDEVVISDSEKAIGEDFGNTPEEIEKYKKEQEAKA